MWQQLAVAWEKHIQLQEMLDAFRDGEKFTRKYSTVFPEKAETHNDLGFSLESCPGVIDREFRKRHTSYLNTIDNKKSFNSTFDKRLSVHSDKKPSIRFEQDMQNGIKEVRSDERTTGKEEVRMTNRTDDIEGAKPRLSKASAPAKKIDAVRVHSMNVLISPTNPSSTISTRNRLFNMNRETNKIDDIPGTKASGSKLTLENVQEEAC